MVLATANMSTHKWKLYDPQGTSLLMRGSSDAAVTILYGGGVRGCESQTPISRSFYSCFLPPSVGFPTSLFYVDCKMLCNIVKFFPFLPVPATLSILLPTLSPPTSRTSPAPILLGSCPPVLFHSMDETVLVFYTERISWRQCYLLNKVI